MKRTRVYLAAGVVIAIGLIAVACTTLPFPLPFQTQATPAAGAKPGAVGETAKPGGAQAQGKPGGAGAGVPVVTAPVTTGKVTATLSFSGTITASQQTVLVPKVAGRIEKIFVDVGDQVKAGQTLVQLDHGTLDAAVKQAEANVMSAQARLSTVLAGARSEDVGIARAQLDSARARLGALEAGGRAEDIAAAQAAAQSAQARLKQVQDGSRDADIKASEQTVQAAQATFNAAVSTYNKLKTPNQDELAAAKALVDKTQAVLGVAQSAYDKVGWRPDIAGRPEAITLQTATADYQSAVATLRLRQSPREEDLAAAQKQIDSARAQLDATKARLDQLKTGATPEDLQIATSTLIQAQQTLAKARNPSTEQDIEVQRQAVKQAEQTYALRQQPFTDPDVQTARAALAQVQAALELAKVNALEGSITAPYDGIIIARPLAEGALSNAATGALTIASAQTEVILSVDEGRIGQIKVGLPVTFEATAYPGQVFLGKVIAIAPTADARTRTFPVRIRAEPLDPRLLPGMFAEVKIVIAEKNNVVVVPKNSVLQKGGRNVAFIVVDGRAKQIDVTAGLSDEVSVEVPEGIKAGDMVVTAGQATISDNDVVRVSGPAGAGGAGTRPQGAGTKPEGGAAPAAGTKPDGAVPAAGAKPDGAAPAAGIKPDGAVPAAGTKPDRAGPAAGTKPDGAVPAAGTKVDGAVPAAGTKAEGAAPAAREKPAGAGTPPAKQ